MSCVTVKRICHSLKALKEQYCELTTIIGRCQVAKLRTGIKPTALCSVIDKENSIEFSLDSVYYLYNRSNPNPALSPAPPYESTCSYASVNIKNQKKKKRKRKRKTIFKIKEKKKKKENNNDLAVVASHDRRGSRITRKDCG